MFGEFTFEARFSEYCDESECECEDIYWISSSAARIGGMFTWGDSICTLTSSRWSDVLFHDLLLWTSLEEVRDNGLTDADCDF